LLVATELNVIDGHLFPIKPDNGSARKRFIYASLEYLGKYITCMFVPYVLTTDAFRWVFSRAIELRYLIEAYAVFEFVVISIKHITCYFKFFALVEETKVCTPIPIDITIYEIGRKGWFRN